MIVQYAAKENPNLQRDEVIASACLYVCLSTSRSHKPDDKLLQVSLHDQSYSDDNACTSGFVNDVKFAHNQHAVKDDANSTYTRSNSPGAALGPSLLSTLALIVSSQDACPKARKATNISDASFLQAIDCTALSLILRVHIKDPGWTIYRGWRRRN